MSAKPFLWFYGDLFERSRRISGKYVKPAPWDTGDSAPADVASSNWCEREREFPARKAPAPTEPFLLPAQTSHINYFEYFPVVDSILSRCGFRASEVLLIGADNSSALSCANGGVATSGPARKMQYGLNRSLIAGGVRLSGYYLWTPHNVSSDYLYRCNDSETAK